MSQNEKLGIKWLIILNLIQAILFKNIRLVITFFWGLTFVMSVRTDVDVHGVIGTGGVSAVSTELTSAAASVSSLSATSDWDTSSTGDAVLVASPPFSGSRCSSRSSCIA